VTISRCKPFGKEGWQKVAVDPFVVAARTAGISYGFLLFDDTGAEWKRDGEKFSFFSCPTVSSTVASHGRLTRHT
jgi:hypothetical protein